MTTQEAHAIHPALRDALMLYEIAESEYLSKRDSLIKNPDVASFKIARETLRQRDDAFIATVRDHIHQAMMNIPFDYRMLHSVITALDERLNRSRK